MCAPRSSSFLGICCLEHTLTDVGGAAGGVNEGDCVGFLRATEGFKNVFC